MERREGARKPVNLGAMIEYLSGMPGRKVTGRIRDVSLSGLYLEMPSADLTSYARLRLIFGPDREDAGPTRIWNCFVVRVTDTGVGAMFDNADPSAIDGLLDLLRDSSAHPTVEGNDPR
ncbi:PilZ domain-containing protein [Thioalkalivibrio denitrificans]|uniref:PilZ domain-containing protein n=1 Tax=Thioalkalivibrio denitrificans TaxID=108003 RepID=A0A1V3NT20_9GAMM|nr:PilZ domain-containing protein [Thioalkalivibrio denitrificans]OOG28103.1 PilZ domain-containing protein [Thioalkalivibrio denitrificans]